MKHTKVLWSLELYVCVLSIILFNSLFASQINKIVSLVNQKNVSTNVIIRYSHFQNIKKCLYIMTLYKMT
jgi:hypothetical protein